jgi:hypothetical protein
MAAAGVVEAIDVLKDGGFYLTLVSAICTASWLNSSVCLIISSVSCCEL